MKRTSSVCKIKIEKIESITGSNFNQLASMSVTEHINQLYTTVLLLPSSSDFHHVIIWAHDVK